MLVHISSVNLYVMMKPPGIDENLFAVIIINFA